MKDRNSNIIYEKSFNFAVKIIELYRYLSNENKEYILSKQLLKSGTSIGANVREAIEGQSKKDFIAKLAIALKEATETEYWLDLLRETKYIDNGKYESLSVLVKEIIKILNSIIKTAKKIRNSC